MNKKLAIYFLVAVFAAESLWALTCRSALGQGKQYNVLSRGQAEKRFKLEQQAYEKAGPSDLVAVEWIFLPYYFPLGHSALRVGNTVWEFTSKGWKVHGTGGDNARAFLYNNPFFRTQYGKFESEESMVPFSIGRSKMFPKSLVEKLFQSNDKLEQAKSFSVLLRNCNQCLIDLTNEHQLDFSQPQTWYEKFSSVRTFQPMLEAASEVNIYPLPNAKIEAGNISDLIPQSINESRTNSAELLRVVMLTLKRTKMRYFDRQVPSVETSTDQVAVDQPKPDQPQ